MRPPHRVLSSQGVTFPWEVKYFRDPHRSGLRSRVGTACSPRLISHSAPVPRLVPDVRPVAKKTRHTARSTFEASSHGEMKSSVVKIAQFDRGIWACSSVPPQNLLFPLLTHPVSDPARHFPRVIEPHRRTQRCKIKLQPGSPIFQKNHCV